MKYTRRQLIKGAAATGIVAAAAGATVMTSVTAAYTLPESALVKMSQELLEYFPFNGAFMDGLGKSYLSSRSEPTLRQLVGELGAVWHMPYAAESKRDIYRRINQQCLDEMARGEMFLSDDRYYYSLTEARLSALRLLLRKDEKKGDA